MSLQLPPELAINLEVTHPDKMIWPAAGITKEKYLSYLVRIAPYMLPFLKNRPLTSIRYPHGVAGPHFFQKNCPDYAPDFIQTAVKGDNRFILCEDLPTLFWLGNQLAIEFHLPFNRADAKNPLEIVIDLDPPDRRHFSQAVDAARILHDVFNRLEINSFPKLSGSRGLQIHLPLIDQQLNFEETRLFTAFLARLLVQQHPEAFTIERLKKKRGDRLYIDYLQHAAGKTIICPYSPRAKADATIAAPLSWDEVTKDLRLEKFTLDTVLERIDQGEDPWKNYFKTKNQSLVKVITALKKQG
ncbi:MAG: non-homologous end-joining DNA ligase [Sporolactobacillus sp.]